MTFDTPTKKHILANYISECILDDENTVWNVHCKDSVRVHYDGLALFRRHAQRAALMGVHTAEFWYHQIMSDTYRRILTFGANRFSFYFDKGIPPEKMDTAK